MEKTTFGRSRWLLRGVMLVCLWAVLLLPARAADWDGAVKAMVAGMEQEQATIDISAYKLPVEGFWDEYHDLYNQGYFPWYVASIGAQLMYSGEYVTSVSPPYLSSAAYSRSTYEQKVSQILSETVSEGMNGWQIALSIHDWIINHCAYDERYYTDYANVYRSGYDLLVRGKAVCTGYAQAYMDLMNRAGVPCVMVSGTAGGESHAWNLVQLNGNWYHVDATWDDPTTRQKDNYGHVRHDYFLISDATISDSDHKHTTWDRYYSCTDNRYETNCFWNNLNNPVIFMGNTVSFQRRGDSKAVRITRRDSYTAEETILYEADIASLNIGAGRYFYSSYGLSLWNGMLYFSDMNHVYSLPLTGGEAQIVYTYDTSAYSKVISGCFVTDNKLFITTRDHSGNLSEFSVKLPVPSHIHSYSSWQTEPTCQAEGYTTFACLCGSSFTSGTLAIVDHQYTSWDVTAEPSLRAPGVKVSGCKWCDATITEEIPALSTAKGTFSDVSSGQYYYEPVLWASVRGVTTGMTATTFCPDTTCTRAQIVTFLWRAMGEPDPTGSTNSFTDVKQEDWYYEAVLWAVEQGITNGTSASTFSPNAGCTRAQVVTFLWRCAGEPVGSGGNPFRDVGNGYYYDAVLWVVSDGITAGVSPDSFAPDDTCTRGQIVTFLYRYMM